MKDMKSNIEPLRGAELVDVSGGDDFETAWGVMLGLAFIAGATGLAAPLAGAIVIGAILSAS